MQIMRDPDTKNTIHHPLYFRHVEPIKLPRMLPSGVLQFHS